MRNFVVVFLVFLASFKLTAQNLGYVANTGSNSVSVVDLDSNVVIATVGVGSSPFGVAVNPDRSKVYITNVDDELVSVIGGASSTVIATITGFGGEVTGVALNPGGTKGYVTLANTLVGVFDTSSDTIIGFMNFATVGDFAGVTITPDGTKGYVAVSNGTTVEVFNALTDTPSTSIDMTDGSYWVAINPEGTKAYVTIDNDNFPVKVIDTGTDTIIATITGFDRRLGIAVSPTETKAFTVGNSSVGIEINTLTDKISNIFINGSSAAQVAFSEDGTRAYVTNVGDDNVSVLDTATNSVIATITVGTSPTGVAGGPLAGGDTFLLRAAGEAKRDVFLTQVDFFNVIRWTQGATSNTEYRIYRDADLTNLIGTVAAGGQRVFEDHNRSPGTTYTYYIAGFSGGSLIQQTQISITTGN